MDNDGAGHSGPKCAVFEGAAASFAQWIISFTAWIAWKRPELVALMRGKKRPRPIPAAPPATLANTEARDEWDLQNTQLYGAILSHVHTPIQASLHVMADGAGTKALRYLKNTFGSQTVGDRAEATARLQKTYFDPRAKLNEADVVRQYNEMALANADIVSAGGTSVDQALLISLFENALPISYSHIRQMVRYAKHSAFQDYYDDLLSQVKAELRSSQRDSVGAFYINSVDPANCKRAEKARVKEKAKAAKAKERGKAKVTEPCRASTAYHTTTQSPTAWSSALYAPTAMANTTQRSALEVLVDQTEIILASPRGEHSNTRSIARTINGNVHLPTLTRLAITVATGELEL
jgi:hypothetical protein